MAYLINPMPHMGDQRLFGGHVRGFIDPTCGRYCLRALLKYWREKAGQGNAGRMKLPKPNSFVRNRIGYDPYDDYQYSNELLVEDWGNLPGSINAWEELMIALDGPIILRGRGLGAAASFVSHFILLVGADQEKDEFSFLDPLRGNVLRTEAAETMLPKIARPYVYAKPDIQTKLIADDKYFRIKGLPVDLPN
jgi:hypothetical protein